MTTGKKNLIKPPSGCLEPTKKQFLTPPLGKGGEYIDTPHHLLRSNRYVGVAFKGGLSFLFVFLSLLLSFFLFFFTVKIGSNMYFIVSNVFTKFISEANDDYLETVVKSFLTHEGKRFVRITDPDNSRRKVTRAKPFIYRLFSEKTHLFPTGLLFPLRNYLTNELGYEFKAYNKLTLAERKPLKISNFTGKEIVLDYLSQKHGLSLDIVSRPEMLEAVEIAINKIRGFLQISVGVGKTAIGAMIAAELGCDFIYLVPNKTLLDQTYETFVNIFGTEIVGKIGGSEYELDKLITIALPNKIVNRVSDNDLKTISFLLRQKAVYIDECHHIRFAISQKYRNIIIKGNRWYDTCIYLKNAGHRIAVSGTPKAEDPLANKFLTAMTGELLYSITSSDAWNASYIRKPKVIIYFGTPVPSYFSDEKDFQSVYFEGLLNNLERNRIIILTANYYVKLGKSVLIVVERTEQHSKILVDLFNTMKKELDPRLIVKELIGSDKERTPVFDALNRKEINVLISTLTKEGVDIPSLDVLIMAGGLKAVTSTIQKAGRVVRNAENKEQPIIVDFDDGLINNSKSFISKHAARRIRLYEKEGYDFEKLDYQEWANRIAYA